MTSIVVLSGKGGTGKTSLTAALAVLASRSLSLVLADADVDASNLAILLETTLLKSHDFIGGYRASIDRSLCTSCGRCREVCRFDAVLRLTESGRTFFTVDGISCEGCNACVHQCPSGAVTSRRVTAGQWFISDSSCGVLFHAAMSAGEENSGKLVTTVRKAALKTASETDADILLIDGPPGIGCPVIASCTGADLALISTEPSVSAIHDLERILGTVRHFGVAPAVCINRSDINPSRSLDIEDYLLEEGIPLLGRIPYDPAVPEAVSRGLPVNLFAPSSPSSLAVEGIWRVLSTLI